MSILQFTVFLRVCAGIINYFPKFKNAIISF